MTANAMMHRSLMVFLPFRLLRMTELKSRSANEALRHACPPFACSRPLWACVAYQSSETLSRHTRCPLLGMHAFKSEQPQTGLIDRHAISVSGYTKNESASA